MLELKQPFGEHCATAKHSLPAVTFLEKVIHEGIRIDAVGVQLLFGVRELGRHARDIAQISSLLDRFFLHEIPVLISALGVPSRVVDRKAGHIRGSWTPETQSRWVSRIFAVAMSKPFVESVFWADLVDHEGADVPATGLIDDNGRPKPALNRLVGIRKRLKQPLGPLKLPQKSTATPDTT
jgi:hypothetical protein